ncbi:MAG: LacI family transcriptional regulator [Planctomycetota bacterium]|nr:LacI family transcriptional regulator [Planctomycetota bacterium]
MGQILFENKALLHVQVRERILGLIRKEGLDAGDALPTYRDLSQRLQVSLVTVQRAMSELTREGVVSGRPGRGTVLARSVLGERKLVQAGLVFYCTKTLLFSSAYLMDLFRGMLLATESRGADARILSIKSEGRLKPEEIAESGVDGVVLCAVANDAYLGEFAASGLPTVVVDYRSAAAALDSVVVDNATGVREVLEHLHRLGHRRIGYVDGWSTDTVAGTARGGRDPIVETSDTLERREAYRMWMAERGLSEFETVYPIGEAGADASIRRAAEAWRAAEARPTALLGYDASVTQMLGNELSALGVCPPEDVSLAAAVDSGATTWGNRLLTSCRVDFAAMGRAAIDALERRLRAGRSAPAQTLFMVPTLVPGATALPVANARN